METAPRPAGIKPAVRAATTHLPIHHDTRRPGTMSLVTIFAGHARRLARDLSKQCLDITAPGQVKRLLRTSLLRKPLAGLASQAFCKRALYRQVAVAVGQGRLAGDLFRRLHQGAARVGGGLLLRLLSRLLMLMLDLLHGWLGLLLDLLHRCLLDRLHLLLLVVSRGRGGGSSSSSSSSTWHLLGDLLLELLRRAHLGGWLMLLDLMLLRLLDLLVMKLLLAISSGSGLGSLLHVLQCRVLGDAIASRTGTAIGEDVCGSEIDMRAQTGRGSGGSRSSSRSTGVIHVGIGLGVTMGILVHIGIHGGRGTVVLGAGHGNAHVEIGGV